MVYTLSYRRPSHVNSSRESIKSISGEEKQNSINESVQSGSSGMSFGIPEALSFDRIIAGGTCPPCTTRDFMNYLKYIELSAENLQFYLWHRDYTKRFEELPESERTLSPEWTMEQAEKEALNAQNIRKSSKMSLETAAVFKGTGFDSNPQIAKKPSHTDANPFHTPPGSPSPKPDDKRDVASLDSVNGSERPFSPSKAAVAKRAEGAFDEAGLKWQPFTVQPYREEISRIITIYISDGATRQLNLSSRERTALLHALENTTHPSAFREVLTTIEWSLRCQAHPNFIRWTICNGNRPRVIFARGLGVGGIVGGIVTGILLCLSSANRPWRLLSFLGFFIGISTLIAAWKGMCVVLHGMHHRHLRPWELFSEDDEIATEEIIIDEKKKTSMESIASSNSWEDEPWVARYEKRNLVRKVFDREVWIQEPALRQIQDTIFLQAILAAFVVSVIATGIFCAVPNGGFF